MRRVCFCVVYVCRAEMLRVEIECGDLCLTVEYDELVYVSMVWWVAAETLLLPAALRHQAHVRQRNTITLTKTFVQDLQASLAGVKTDVLVHLCLALRHTTELVIKATIATDMQSQLAMFVRTTVAT